MRRCGQRYFPPKLTRTLIRPAFQVLLLNVQESVLREAETRLPQDLQLLLDERSLCFIQRALGSFRCFRTNHPHGAPPVPAGLRLVVEPNTASTRAVPGLRLGLHELLGARTRYPGVRRLAPARSGPAALFDE